MIKLLIFDLDGTLVDSIYDITDALNFALSTYTQKIYEPDEVKHFVGSGFKILLKQAAPEEKHHKEIQEKFLSYYRQNLTIKTRPFDGVVDTLKQLNECKKAVVTNKIESFSREILENLNLDMYFETVIGGDTLPYQKPSPEPIREVLRKLTLSPDEALMIGDGEHDIEAGKAAGMITVAVAYGYREREQLRNADFLIDDIRQMIPLLKTLEKFGTRIL